MISVRASIKSASFIFALVTSLMAGLGKAIVINEITITLLIIQLGRNLLSSLTLAKMK